MREYIGSNYVVFIDSLGKTSYYIENGGKYGTRWARGQRVVITQSFDRPRIPTHPSLAHPPLNPHPPCPVIPQVSCVTPYFDVADPPPSLALRRPTTPILCPPHPP